MTSFAFTGTYLGDPSQGRVEGGMLIGDEFLAAHIAGLVAEDLDVGSGSITRPAGLEGETQARVTLLAVMDEVSFDPPHVLTGGAS